MLLEQALSRVSELEEQVTKLYSELNNRHAEVFILKERLELFNKKFFGSKSEKYKVSPEQQSFFNEAEQTVHKEEQAKKKIKVRAHERKPPGRNPISPALPRNEIIIDLSEEEKICCAKPMKKIGEDKCEKVDMVPPEVIVNKYIRPKYGCDICDKPPQQAELPHILPHSIADNGLFAFTLTAKFCDAIPFHRLESMLARFGVDYPRANMSNNLIQFYEKFGERILGLMEERFLQGKMGHIDETTCLVMNEEGRANNAKSYMWAFLGNGVTFYQYHETRQALFLGEFLKNYKGNILTDGYKPYDQIFTNLPEIIHAGCNAHTRRYFMDAYDDGKHKAAEEPILIYRELYKIESEIKNLQADERLRIRQDQSRPLMEKFLSYLKEKESRVTPKSLLGKAVTYTINQWPKLVRFLDDPSIPIDNNIIENAIRPFVVGRNYADIFIMRSSFQLAS